MIVIACSPSEDFAANGSGGHQIIGGEEPSIFPLKAGDEIEFVAGGRVTLGEESGEKVLKGTYKIREVYLDKTSHRWLIDADYIFESMASDIESDQLKPLLTCEMLPLGSVFEGKTVEGRQTFTTDSVLGSVGKSAFPFFDFDPTKVSEQNGVFASASRAFEKQILQIDPHANIRMQPAASRFEAYFKDPRFEKPYLHELRLTFSSMGFIANVEERLQFWRDGMQRNVGSFNSVEISAVFPVPVKLKRDGKSYSCSVLTGICRTQIGEKKCLERDHSIPPRSC